MFELVVCGLFSCLYFVVWLLLLLVWVLLLFDCCWRAFGLDLLDLFAERVLRWGLRFVIWFLVVLCNGFVIFGFCCVLLCYLIVLRQVCISIDVVLLLV